MTTDFTKDDNLIMELFNSNLYHTNSKVTPRGNPNQRLSYASYFEEEDAAFDAGQQAKYGELGEIVNVVDVDVKSMTATIELPDETTLFEIPLNQLTHI